MFHKRVLCILILSFSLLMAYSDEGDRDHTQEKVAEAAGQKATTRSICDRTILVQDALLDKAGKKDCEQMTDQDLQAIIALDLSEKSVEELKANDFSGLTSLQRLYLDRNNLASLPEGIFSGLTSLQSLSLNGNSLGNLSEGIFSGLISLQRLDLDHNNLANLPLGIFSGLTSLWWLYLDASLQQDKNHIINEMGREIDIVFVDFNSSRWKNLSFF